MNTAAMLFDMFRNSVAAPLYERAGPIEDLEKGFCPYPGNCPRRAHACIRRKLACACGDPIASEEIG